MKKIVLILMAMVVFGNVLGENGNAAIATNVKIKSISFRDDHDNGILVRVEGADLQNFTTQMLDQKGGFIISESNPNRNMLLSMLMFHYNNGSTITIIGTGVMYNNWWENLESLYQIVD